ncbi:MAG: ABC transporter ATP-binding protein [Alphaproteobacteria bacterium]|nr:ABC transporter ATP-binding protein [Alphaproteobacteria bacterium]
MTLLSADAISVRLGRTLALDAVSLAVAPGEFVGLVGPNGAGKTTFLRAAAGLVPLAGGALRIKGSSIDDLGAAGVARTLAYLPHGAPCHWPMAARRIVALGRIPHLGAWRRPSAADEAVLDRAMARAQVEEFAARPVKELSDGERARVMIARALAQEPDLLLADEPTAALDPYHQLRVLEILRGIADAGGGVLAVFHDLPMAARFCTRLALLVRGRVLADGAVAAVLTPEHVRAAYGVEIAAHQATTFTLPARLLP